MSGRNIGIGIDTEHEEGGMRGRSLAIKNNAEAQQTLTRRKEQLDDIVHVHTGKARGHQFQWGRVA